MPGSGLTLAFGLLTRRSTPACTGTCAPLHCRDSQQLLQPQRQAYPQGTPIAMACGTKTL